MDYKTISIEKEHAFHDFQFYDKDFYIKDGIVKHIYVRSDFIDGTSTNSYIRLIEDHDKNSTHIKSDNLTIHFEDSMPVKTEYSDDHILYSLDGLGYHIGIKDHQVYLA